MSLDSETEALPAAEKTYLFKDLYVETRLGNPKKSRSFAAGLGLGGSDFT